jgi:hypothetical protein
VVAVGPLLSGNHWWVAVLALVLLGCLLVVAACWMVKFTDAAEVQTPLIAWKRRSAEEEEPQRPVVPPPVPSDTRGSPRRFAWLRGTTRR